MFKLIIETDSYIGNFKRELIAYSLGISPNNENGFSAFIRPFWDSVVGTGVECYDNYIKFYKDYYKEMSDEDILNSDDFHCKRGLTIKESIDRYRKNRKQMESEEIIHLYDYLEYAIQNVDDSIESTFYNIYNSNSLFIQFKEMLPKRFERIIIKQIKKFFNLDILNKIRDYEYICEFDEVDRKQDNPVTLKRLYIVDEVDNIIKEFDVNTDKLGCLNSETSFRVMKESFEE